MDKLETNVLIIGKSGAGKSSLLNYLFGCKKQETGVGKPVTPKELFSFTFDYDNEFKINIYDTWGLEPDKAETWKKLIMDKVKECDAEEINQWFNTIIFCLNGNSQIVEDFEIEYMRELIKEKNNIVIAITHCYEGMGEMVDRHMTQRLIKDAQIPQNNIIYVSSVEGMATIGGLQAKKFGRDEIFCSIIHNLWISLVSKVPYRLEKKLEEKIYETRAMLMTTVKEKNIFFRRDKALKEIESMVNNEIEMMISNGIQCMNDSMQQSADYYNRLSKKYADIALLNRKDIKINPNGNFHPLEDFQKLVSDMLERIAESQNKLSKLTKTLLKDEIRKEIIKDWLVAVKERCTSSSKIKRNLLEAIDEQITKVKIEFKNNLSKIQKQLQQIDVQDVSACQLQVFKNSD